MLKLICILYLSIFLSKIDELCEAQQFAPDNISESWTGKWFPHPPWVANTDLSLSAFTSSKCDDAKHNIEIDYDPKDAKNSYLFLCLENKELFNPDINSTVKLMEYEIPPSYSAPSKCINETIYYEENIPTFGAYRFLPPKFGTYKYLPPQRWMHSIAKGAVVLLYHPCAEQNQLTLLKRIVKRCIYHHIISPYNKLLSSRPFALVVWGKRLEMSVVNKEIVTDFIKQHIVKKIVNTNEHVAQEFYDVDLITEANLITDNKDNNPCDFFN